MQGAQRCERAPLMCAGVRVQTADTVIMYDPDANPKNEEQAVARSHRIGQKKPVRVIHLETVADAPPDALQVADVEYADDGAHRRAPHRMPPLC